MRFLTFCHTISFIAILAISSCSDSHYKIIETKESTVKNQDSFIESIITSAGLSPDTILHFRFSLDNDDYYFYENPRLDLGIAFKKSNSASYTSFNVIYLVFSKEEKLPSLQKIEAQNEITLANYWRENGNKRSERSFGIPNGLRDISISTSVFTNTDDMNDFLRIFQEEISKTLSKEKRLKYISTTGYGVEAKTIEMTIDYN